MDVLLIAALPLGWQGSPPFGFYYRKSRWATPEMGWSVAAPLRERIPIYIYIQ